MNLVGNDLKTNVTADSECQHRGGPGVAGLVKPGRIPQPGQARGGSKYNGRHELRLSQGKPASDSQVKSPQESSLARLMFRVASNEVSPWIAPLVYS